MILTSLSCLIHCMNITMSRKIKTPPFHFHMSHYMYECMQTANLFAHSVLVCDHKMDQNVRHLLKTWAVTLGR